ncbi:(3S,6E)-nerolidol synthase 1-like isoform X2 [Cucumis melo]|uniref:(3S,6E)-nerolidol synthase 1-like isoform X2 n=1 Tax=Cucumis melo TaxID=3656 RepID=A0A1S4E662_CUCME|nr:(3S,6E)-nerolidol synthase 1-like isoform X2 [Cucumis melo]
MAQLIYLQSFLASPPRPKIFISQTKIPHKAHNNNAWLQLNNPLEKSFAKKGFIHALNSSSSSNKIIISDLKIEELGVETPARKVKILKELLTETRDDLCLECLEIIDAAQRLGIDNQFEEEIEDVLKRQYALINAYHFDGDVDLHKAALLFRLLRQQRYLVSQDVFKVFLNEKGKFKEKLKADLNGMTSLYEASQLRIHGDDILEEAEDFSSHCLNNWATRIDNQSSASFVMNTLAHPHYRSVAQFMVPNYFGDKPWTNKWLNLLQDVGRTNFITTQTLRQHEIALFLKWWEETGLVKELNFARNQPIQRYLGSVLCLPDPCYSEQRLQLAKSMSLIYVIDDIFDVHGTLDQLRLFTQAVIRWDMDGVESLPNSMQLCYKCLLEVTNELSLKVYKKHGWNPVGSLRKTWVKLCKAFLLEAEWLSCGHSPSAEEYLRNGVVSSGVNAILVHTFFLLGQQVNNRTVELLDNDSDIVLSSGMILRLWDDMGNAKDEKQMGRDGSYAEYYMKEHPNISSEETQQHTKKKISEAWKTLNTEHLFSNIFPTSFTQASLNIARAVPLAYNYGRNQSIMTVEKLMEQYC